MEEEKLFFILLDSVTERVWIKLTEDRLTGEKVYFCMQDAYVGVLTDE